MEKMRMESIDSKQFNIKQIEAIFPGCIVETSDVSGNLRKGINFERLKEYLSGEITDGAEVYEFSWVGKKQSLIEANRPIRKTLRPDIDSSCEWNSTENLYIEGDNLDVLKLLQESYFRVYNWKIAKNR